MTRLPATPERVMEALIAKRSALELARSPIEETIN
jgi:hypothetical protein